jgi:hypothetical protein
MNDNGGTFTLKGRWLYNCNGKPHAYDTIRIQISVLTKTYPSHVTKEYDGGSGITDSQGYFSIICDNYGSSTLKITTQNRFYSIGVPGGNGKVYDMGDTYLYDAYTASAILKVVFATPHSDTFYIGYNNDIYGSIYPATGTKYLVLNGDASLAFKNNNFGYYSIFNYSYGFSWSGYWAAYHNYQFYALSNIFSVCTSADTTTLYIP